MLWNVSLIVAVFVKLLTLTSSKRVITNKGDAETDRNLDFCLRFRTINCLRNLVIVEKRVYIRNTRCSCDISVGTGSYLSLNRQLHIEIFSTLPNDDSFICIL